MPALTDHERRIIEVLADAGEPLHGRDFASVASVRTGRWEWANPFLQRLQAKGLAEKGTTKSSQGFPWTITEAGRAALLDPPEPAPPPPKTLTLTMQNELRRLGRAETENREFETVCNRATWQGLERRGLVSLVETGSGWMQPSLTDAGRELLGIPVRGPVQDAADPGGDGPQ
ncbi:PadR family transcriptional regulator [Cereibacter sphaeroides]|uniref:PadR family transcriptional regulator n=1 Tax=Cereibacter sphaeroides TaxID=1063 RepID=UPI001F361300|nr:PadR family transcriptional regulator [Cereibacter sphaeroides]MCE6957910.1 PadR family transcriptional regulator [Cereibacter sphaeroides]MCE6971742.1 PadR family transcriptional regulator [Cereibacter sphaeroides]